VISRNSGKGEDEEAEGSGLEQEVQDQYLPSSLNGVWREGGENSQGKELSPKTNPLWRRRWNKNGSSSDRSESEKRGKEAWKNWGKGRSRSDQERHWHKSLYPRRQKKRGSNQRPKHKHRKALTLK